MAGLWRKNPETPEGKYLLKRRDGSIVKVPFMAFLATDPAAPAGLRGYADRAEELKFDPEYVQDVRDLAMQFEDFFVENPPGDPDAPRHREDDPATIAEMRQALGA